MEKKSKIYVAGHTGLVGSAIVRKLQSEGYTNLILRTRNELDLLDSQQVKQFFKLNLPEYVILASAKVGGVMLNKEYPFEMLYENTIIQNNVIGSAYYHGTKKLLFIASSTIYPSDCSQPIKEESLLLGSLDSIHESYGIAKICGLKMCEKIFHQSSKLFFTLVPTNIYGIGDHFEESRAHVIGALFQRFYDAKINNIKEVVVRGSGNAMREFIYVDDVAEACLFFLSAKNLKHTNINIGSNDEIAIKDLAVLIGKTVGYDGKISFDMSKPEGRMRRKLDTNLASSYGWDAQVSLENGIKKTYEYFLSKL